MRFWKKSVVIRKVLLVTLAVSVISACTHEDGRLHKTNIGTVTGAVLGGIVGSQFGGGEGKIAMGVLGAALGGLAGHAIGSQLDKADLEYQSRTAYEALEYNRTGAASRWENPDSRHYGSFIPTRTYVDSRGRNCREYTTKIFVGQKMEEGFGRACRRDDGSWEIIS